MHVDHAYPIATRMAESCPAEAVVASRYNFRVVTTGRGFVSVSDYPTWMLRGPAPMPLKVGMYRLLRKSSLFTDRYTNLPISLPMSVKLKYCYLIHSLLPTPVHQHLIRSHMYLCSSARTVPRDTGRLVGMANGSRLSCRRV